MVKVHAIGGFSEVGRNMACIEFEEDAFILDCGLYLTPIVEVEESENLYHERGMRGIGAVPDDYYLDKLDIRKKVRAIFISHAHLDHLGALPYLAHRYDAPIIGTPYSIEVLKAICRDSDIKIPNKMQSVEPNSEIKIGNYRIEFLHLPHSTLQTALIAIHSPEGAVVYVNDPKFDETPILNPPTNYKRIKEIGEEGVLTLIVDGLYSDYKRKTPSEKIARDMLEEVLTKNNNENVGIIVTTFASHIPRLKSVVEFSKRIGRKTLFLGRSMYRYVTAAERLGLAPFTKDIEILTYKNQVKRRLRQIAEERQKWIIVCTGNQGEPNSVLVKIANEVYPFHIKSGDHIIFSSRTIPTPITIANREKLEKNLHNKGARIFTDVHTSGHLSREDIRDLIGMLSPKHIIPIQGDIKTLTPVAELGKEIGYELGKNIYLMQDGESLELH